jgi:hypothetical protein
MAHTTSPLQSREWLQITRPFKLRPLRSFSSSNLSFGSRELAQLLLRTTPLKVLSFNPSSSLWSWEWPWIIVQCRIHLKALIRGSHLSPGSYGWASSSLHTTSFLLPCQSDHQNGYGLDEPNIVWKLLFKAFNWILVDVEQSTHCLTKLPLSPQLSRMPGKVRTCCTSVYAVILCMCCIVEHGEKSITSLQIWWLVFGKKNIWA